MNEKNFDSIYRIQFKSEQNHYDIYVRHVYPSDMHGFICLEGFLFHEETQLLINPRTEKLAAEFSEVKTAFIPYHQIIRIDEVKKVGESHIKRINADGKITPFSPSL